VSESERGGHDADAIVGEILDRAWLDTSASQAAPPEGDLPDDFAARSRTPGSWSRIRAALTRG